MLCRVCHYVDLLHVVLSVRKESPWWSVCATFLTHTQFCCAQMGSVYICDPGRHNEETVVLS